MYSKYRYLRQYAQVEATRRLVYNFVRWSDGVTSLERSIAVTGSGDIAYYSLLYKMKIQHSLNIRVPSSLVTTDPSANSYWADEDSVVSIKATFPENYKLVKWIVNGVDFEPINPLVLTIDTAYDVEPVIEEIITPPPTTSTSKIIAGLIVAVTVISGVVVYAGKKKEEKDKYKGSYK